MSATPPVQHGALRREHTYLLGVTITAAVLVLAVLIVTTMDLFQTQATRAGANSASQSAQQSRSASPTPSSTVSAASQQQLSALLDAFAAKYPTAGVVLLDEATGATAQHQETETFTSASLYKLFVAYRILARVDAGSLNLSNTLAGTGGTYADCMEQMITVSSNTCGVALGHVIGWAKLDTEITAAGFTHTHLDNVSSSGALDGNQTTTPADVALLLQRLEAGKLLSNSSTAYFEKLLSEQKLNYALPTGLDSRISFAHKTGVLDTVSHDAGILNYQGHKLIVVLMTNGWTNAYSQSIPVFTDLGQRLSSYLLGSSASAAPGT